MIRTVLSVAIVAAAVSLLPACSSTQKTASSGTANSMSATISMLEKAQTTINDTVASMQSLASAGAAEIAPAYRAFSNQLDELQKVARQTGDRARSMNSRADSFFKNWSEELAEISDPEIRARGEQRQQLTREAYERINTSMQEAKAAFDPLMEKLRDVENVLRNDLNPAGIASVQDIIRGASSDAAKLNKEVGDVISEMTRVREAFAPAG
ncbi:MAG: DUF2959 family protein [Planctomycetota bacterium]|nr:DUF2959 family protein [Planctomycetota bacterium]